MHERYWTLREIDALCVALRPYLPDYEQWPAVRAVMLWIDAVEAGQLLAPVSAAPDGPAPEVAPDNDDTTGPQSGPDGKGAGDLSDSAPGPAPAEPGTGAEAPPPWADEAPALPDAGGGATETEGGHGAPWTDEEWAQVMAMRSDGVPVRLIAGRLGRTEVALRFQIKKRRCAAADEVPPPEAAPVPPAPVPPPEIAPTPPAGRPLWWRVAEKRLDDLGNEPPFTPRTDLQLVEDLMCGRSLSWIGAEMIVSQPDLLARWRTLCHAVGVDEGERPTIEDQTRLLDLLRWRAVEAANG